MKNTNGKSLYKENLRKLILMPLILTMLIPLENTRAAISFDGHNRFFMDDKRKNIIIVNEDTSPVLVQILIAWDKDQSETLPLIVSKPLIMIPPNQKKSVDILYQGIGLPTDRESHFTLSVLEVPENSKQANALQLAIRHHLKLFYRPQLSSSPSEAIAGLKWKRPGITSPTIIARNDSPYYLTLTDIEVQDASGKACGTPIAHWMLSPFSEASQDIPECPPPASVTYNHISDGGLAKPHTAPLTAP